MPYFVFVLAVLLALNILATRRVVAAPDELGLPKRMLIAGIWLVPFMGAWMAKLETRGPRPVQHRSSADASEAPLLLEHACGGPSFNVSEHLAFANGVPLLDWSALSEWAHDGAPPEAAEKGMASGRRAWLLHLRDAMMPEAHLHLTDESCILSTLEPRVVEAAARYIAVTRRRIAGVLGALAHVRSDEPNILIVFNNEDDYYHYVATYYPAEGEFALSGGMYINAGCPHFVAVRGDLSVIEPVIAHELTHSALAHLRLPKWLDEGLAVNTERRLVGAKSLSFTPNELHAMHRKFWNAERIQEFWSGRSFDRTDEGNLLSYELARILVEQLAAPWQSFAAFVASAQREDGGALSAQTHLSMRLGEVVAALFEADAPQSWEPDPRAWAGTTDIHAPA